MRGNRDRQAAALRLGGIIMAGIVCLAACSSPQGVPATTPPPPEATHTVVPAFDTATEQPATPTTEAPHTSAPAFVTATEQPVTPPPSPSPAAVHLRVETVASGLEVPRALAFASDGRLFIAERPGRVRVIRDGALLPEPALTITDIAVQGETGLLGLTLAPDFATSGHVYLYYTYSAGGGLRNRVVRYVAQGDTLAEPAQVIFDDIPGGIFHDGGLLAFGPDGKLYVTTGDTRQPTLAQDLTSLAGKILRLNPDGSVPEDNPFPGSPVYSLGHRNPQGLAWHPETGQLYATEHGETGNDEVNLILAGENYGWPDAQGPQHPAPYRPPLVTYSPAVAPAAAVFYTADLIPQWRGSFIFGTLRGTHLHRLAFAPDDPARVTTDERLFDGQFGRLRAVAQGPDGALYVTTSNRDMLGSPGPTDDRVLRVVPE